MDVQLYFEGPYSWFPGDLPSVLEKDAVTGQPGIYLWTADTPEGELVYYVGETGRSFVQRFTEHLREQLSGWYKVYDAELFVRGEQVKVWPGLYEILDGRMARWAEFPRRLPELAETIADFVEVLRFHLATTDCETRLRRRIEAHIADHLYAQDGLVGDFIEPVRYHPTRTGVEPARVTISSSAEIRGLPRDLDLTPS